MKLHEWLDAEVGRATALGEHMEASKSSVSQWKSNGAPVHLLRRISDFTGGAVSIEELLADIEARKESA